MNLNSEDDKRQKVFILLFYLLVYCYYQLQEWQHVQFVKGGDVQQSTDDAATNGKSKNRILLTATTVDDTLLQTLQDHIYSTSTPHGNLATANSPTKLWCTVLCFEDNTCLGEVLLNSPVLLIDGSDDDCIMSRIGLGSFPNSNSTSAYKEQRHHIGLVLTYTAVDGSNGFNV